MCTVSSEISDLGLMRKSGHTSQEVSLWILQESSLDWSWILHRHYCSRKVSLNDPSWPLPCSHILKHFQSPSSSILMCFKPYQTPQNLTPNFHFALFFTSLHCFTSSGSDSTAFSFSSSHPLFPALHFITPLSHSHPSLSCCYFSCSTTSYPYSSFHSFTPSLAQNVPYLFSQTLLSKKLLYHATIKKTSLFKQVLQLLNLWREAAKSWGTLCGFSF